MRRVEVTVTIAEQGTYGPTGPKFEAQRVTTVDGPPTKARKALDEATEGVMDEAARHLRDAARAEREAEDAAQDES